MTPRQPLQSHPRPRGGEAPQSVVVPRSGGETALGVVKAREITAERDLRVLQQHEKEKSQPRTLPLGASGRRQSVGRSVSRAEKLPRDENQESQKRDQVLRI